MDTTNTPPSAPDQERRKRPDLRKAFEDVIKRIAPFYRQGLVSGNAPMEYWAKRTIREHCPELSAQDVQILVNAASRFFKNEQSKQQAEA